MKYFHHPLSPVAWVLITRLHGARGLWVHLGNIVFDFRRRTDTAKRHMVQGENVNYYATTHYSAISRSILQALAFLLPVTVDEFSRSTINSEEGSRMLQDPSKNTSIRSLYFCDVGAGKGKALMIAIDLLEKSTEANAYLNIDLCGVEIDAALAHKCCDNLKSMYRRRIAEQACCEDAFSIWRAQYISQQFLNQGRRMAIKILNCDVLSNLHILHAEHPFKIFYLCDPLPGNSMLWFVESIYHANVGKAKRVVIIYSNPVHNFKILGACPFLTIEVNHLDPNPLLSYVIYNVLVDHKAE